MELCPKCAFDIPDDWLHCPHCCVGLRPLNVHRANSTNERDELEKRYQAALSDAATRGSTSVVESFEAEILNAGRAVLGSTLKKLLPIAAGDRDVFATYHDLAELRFPQPTATGAINWNTRRPQAETELLGTPKHIDKLHYAALSLDGASLPHYGECTVWLSHRMVSHRASLLSENSAICYDRNGGTIPPGLRSDWEQRAKLCVSKLASALEASTQSTEFPRLLLRAGQSGSGIDDEFVEVEVFGAMTIRTFERVAIKAASPSSSAAVKRPRTRRGTAHEAAIQNYCRNNGVPCELI